MTSNSTVEQSHLDAMDAEFLQEASDDLARFEVVLGNLRANSTPSEDGIGRISADVRKLLSLCAGGDQPLLDLLLRRLDDYLADLESPSERQIDDLDVFADIMRGLLDKEVANDIDQAEFVRSLPVRRPVELEDLEHLNIEILVVEPNRSTGRIIRRDLVNCGYRVATALRSFDAIELSVRTRPDVVLSSLVLDDISGVDLACALAAMSKTKDIPFALVTSYQADHAALAGLPESAAVVRKSSQFGEDLAEALERFKII